MAEFKGNLAEALRMQPADPFGAVNAGLEQSRQRKLAALKQKLEEAGIITAGPALSQSASDLGFDIPAEKQLPLAQAIQIAEQKRLAEQSRQSKADRDAESLSLQNYRKESLGIKNKLADAALNKGKSEREIQLKTAPIAIQNRAADLNEVAFNLQEIKDTYNPEYIGPIAARAGSAEARYIGSTPEAERFYKAATSLQNTIIKARSGGAVTVQEADRLLGEIPDPKSKDFATRMDRAIVLFNQIIERHNKANRQYKDLDPVIGIVDKKAQPQTGDGIENISTEELLKILLQGEGQ